ncbi:hypothetical protein D8674_035361 [Pyrus ussuriensis x Pyrus communis]|uniref:Uncharacterized protein n=1 Tax=Pyrus ussuriensis x Pyrus communis TaxID=2448454 RepID=A0A5N5GC55_9ROSA|nr:hypothetical protein D8674_035361 [Pyrus ussuriensis x Pyrus communis]
MERDGTLSTERNYSPILQTPININAMIVEEFNKAFSSTCEALLTMQDEDTATERYVKAAQNHSPVAKALALNRIFVGGHPPSVDSG